MKKAYAIKLGLGLLLMTALLLMVLSIHGRAEETSIIEGDWQYEVNEGEASIVKYLGNDSNIVIPSELGVYPVTSVGKGNGVISDLPIAKSIESVIIPSSVREISAYAFYECDRLVEVKINEGLEVIGVWAFSECTVLETIEFPDSLVEISDGAFYGCVSLQQVDFPEKVHSIGISAFRECESLKEIYITKNIRKIGYGAFADCKDITKIKVDPDNAKYDSRNDCNAIIIEYNGSDGSYVCLEAACSTTVIPEGVTDIQRLAFWGVYGDKLYIPSSVQYIYDQAFVGADFKIVEVDPSNAYFDSRNNCNAIIKKGNVSIDHRNGISGEYSDVLIFGCSSTVIPNTVQAIRDYAFQNSIIKSIHIPSNVKTVGYWAFYNSSIEEVYMDEGVERLVSNSFGECTKMKRLNIPSSLVNISSSAFDGCIALESIEVAEGNSTYDSRNNCNAIINTESNELLVGSNSTIIPDSVTAIDGDAFKGRTGLTNINFPGSLIYIRQYAFEECSGLQELVLPKGINNIGEYAFKNCKGINIVKIMGQTSIEAGAFNGCDNLKEIWIPDDVKEDNIHDERINYDGDSYPPFAGCTKLTIVTPKDSYAQQYAIEHGIPYRNEDIWENEDYNDEKQYLSDNDTKSSIGEKEKESEQKTDPNTGSSLNTTTDATTEVKTQETVQESTEIGAVKDNPTTFNIKNKKTYKKSKKVTIKDSDGIKSVRLNTKAVKVKAGKKSVSFKLSKYKKNLKKKNKWNKLVVTDVNGNKKTVQFKVK